jgi:hypothetical protein
MSYIQCATFISNHQIVFIISQEEAKFEPSIYSAMKRMNVEKGLCRVSVSTTPFTPITTLVQIRYQISSVVEAGAGVGVVKGREIPDPF